MTFITELHGPFLASCLFFQFLLGLCYNSAYDYYYWHGKTDSMLTKLMVAWVVSLTTLQAIFMWQESFWWFVFHWNDPAALGMPTPWSGNAMNVTTTLIQTTCLCFFAQIAWKALNRNYFYLAVIGLAILVQFAGGAATSLILLITNKPYVDVKYFPQIWLFAGLAADIGISGALVSKFKSLQRLAGDETRNILSQLINLSLRTALLTTLCTVFWAIARYTNGLLAQFPGLIISGLFCISLLHTLNARHTLLVMRTSGVVTSSQRQQPTNRMTNMNRLSNRPAGFSARNTQVHVETVMFEESERAEDHQSMTKSCSDDSLRKSEKSDTLVGSPDGSPKSMV